MRLPTMTVRLRLTLLYGGLFFVSGAVLVVATYLIFRDNTGVNLIVPSGASPRTAAQIAETKQRYDEVVNRSTDALHAGLWRSVIVLAAMTAASVGLGWLVAGRVLRPVREMTATTRQISERNLNERLALAGPDDELKDLADTIDGLLARLEAHVAEQQRFAANASHELRTPLAVTQTLLDVARSDPDREDGELVDHLHAVNSRAIDLTEALLLLSRADRRSFTREPLDLSLLAEEATEALLAPAERSGVTVETSGGPTPAEGSPALLLQLATNLIHNAIVHNLAAGGTVWVRTAREPAAVGAGPGAGEPAVAVLTVENTGEPLAPELVATLTEPFLRGSERTRTERAGVGLGLAIVKSIAEAHEGTLTLTPREGGGLRAEVRLPVHTQP
jgi:two-component system, OmpR family, sensor histidine kinase VanS